jgi:hypothetical protein
LLATGFVFAGHAEEHYFVILQVTFDIFYAFSIGIVTSLIIRTNFGCIWFFGI